MKQYRLTGNFLFLLLLVVLTAAFVTAWSLTDGGVLHELSIAFATSLIALALCLLSDTLLKYKESQNDEYINNLKSFGIENLRFHKDELLELLIPKCRNEIWITGYRLIMTGKSPFAERSARPAPRRRALEFGCWRCRPGAGPTSWYTAQRMCRTIISRFFRSLQLRRKLRDEPGNPVHGKADIQRYL